LNKLSQDVPSQPSIVSFSSALQKFSRKYFLSHGTPAVTDVVVHRRIFTEESKAIIFKFFQFWLGRGVAALVVDLQEIEVVEYGLQSKFMRGIMS